MSIPQAVKEVTGLSADTINKISDLRSAASSETAAPELREAAKKGLEKLSKSGAAVDPVYKSFRRLQEQQATKQVDPVEARRTYLESRLDRVVSEVTLLAERLDGELSSDLQEASSLDQVSRESLRGVRVALTHALAVISGIEAGIAHDPTHHFHVVNAEVSRMFAEEAQSKLLEVAG